MHNKHPYTSFKPLCFEGAVIDSSEMLIFKLISQSNYTPCSVFPQLQSQDCGQTPECFLSHTLDRQLKDCEENFSELD